MGKKFSIRIWVLVAALILSVVFINPNPFARGIGVESISPGSPADLSGISVGDIIEEVNGVKVESVAHFNLEVSNVIPEPITINVLTDKEEYNYEINENLGFITDENLTVINSDFIKLGEKILEVNGKEVGGEGEFGEIFDELFPKKRFVVKTNEREHALLVSGNPGIRVENAKTTNLVTGLDLQGGTRVLIEPISDKEIREDQISDLINILENRLNVFGLSDLTIREASDLEGDKFVLVEIAGASKEDVEELIGRQGVFEAKIGDEVVFTGGERDIVFVCRDDGSCSGVRSCGQVGQNSFACNFQFQISLSEGAAKRHAEITRDLNVNLTDATASPHGSTGYLEKPLDLYLDGQLVDSLRIGADLKGREVTSISISGPGFGNTEDAALDDALNEMNKLQTVMITGSLPFDIEIVKLDSISPFLGEQFVKNIFIVILLAIIAVSVVLLIRYRNIKILIPILVTSISEIIIILGVAALIEWNLDLVAIAGIIAAVGTGVDDQIIIIDEILRGKKEYIGWKEKIKRAFFIIFAAYATTVAAMVPLIWAGAGLIRGFAVITIIGVTIGVLITRPAFAAISEKFFG